jgi:hypothetical protein
MKMRNLLFAMLLAASAAWSDTPPPERGARAELWLLVSSWPALKAVRPAAGGRFDAAGFGLGGALYVSVMEFSNSELLAGIDGFIAANDSNVEGVFDDVLVRQLYLGGSLKWALGEERGFTLVTSGLEREIWEASRVSGHIGASWDLPGYSLGSVGRWMLGMKVHFADFGTVHGPGPIGPDAGRLDGPLYTMQVGYGSR